MTITTTGFIAENLVLSHNRGKIIESYGERKYHIAYSTLSTITTASIAFGYFFHGRGQGPMRALPHPGLRAAAFAFQTLGVIGVSQFFPKLQIPVVFQKESALLSGEEGGASSSGDNKDGLGSNEGWMMKARCPFEFQDTKSGDAQDVSGLQRITRHPAFWTMSFLSLGVALRTRFWTEVVMFLGPVATTLICGNHIDYRHRRHEGGELSCRKEAKTSFIPFVALLEGRQSWGDVYGELKGLNASGAVLCSLILRRRWPS
mmetsp:Transcript_52/g.74  ORF Transcript_52/g.74 Transcript_52/m.74 type:complete len:260 (-) Transcript_52:52-831(-)